MIKKRGDPVTKKREFLPDYKGDGETESVIGEISSNALEESFDKDKRRLGRESLKRDSVISGLMRWTRCHIFGVALGLSALAHGALPVLNDWAGEDRSVFVETVKKKMKDRKAYFDELIRREEVAGGLTVSTLRIERDAVMERNETRAGLMEAYVGEAEGLRRNFFENPDFDADFAFNFDQYFEGVQPNIVSQARMCLQI